MNWKILKKYIQGRCSEQELRQLGAWLQEDPANEDFFKSFIEDWDPEEHAEFEADAQAAWQQFKKRNKLSSSSQPIGSASTKKKSSASANHFKEVGSRGYPYWFSIAAAAVILITTLYFISQDWLQANEQTKPTEIAAQKITTDRGQRTNLRLSDGSLVTLNAESSLEIPENYGDPTRTIYLEGEAFFEVEHDEQHPFIVITPRGYVKDLGTQFNITAYDSSRIEVAVKEGLASLGTVKKGIIQKELVELTPNKLGILKRVGGLTVSDITDMEEFTGWAEGKLVFRETPFPEVVQRLERWFNIECITEDPQLKERTLTATYSNMPLDEVLEVLSVSVRASYEREKRTVTFRDNQE
ncbi:FecR family protein [Fodinibius roseus]|nr:FecR domain-containing protein [Fodinibius roseus]